MAWDPEGQLLPYGSDSQRSDSQLLHAAALLTAAQMQSVLPSRTQTYHVTYIKGLQLLLF